MGEFLQYIMEIIRASWGWISYFSPIKLTIIHQGEIGCRRTWGKPGPNLTHEGPLRGFHFATTGQELQSTQSLNCKIDLGEICVPLKDRVPVQVEAAMTYDVTDAGHWFCNSEDAEWLMSEIQEAELRNALMNTDYEKLAEHMETVEAQALEEAQKKISELKLGGNIRYLRIKKLVVTEASAQAALYIDKLTGALGKIPQELRDDAAFSAMVALIVGAQPVNTLESNGYE